MNKSIDFIKNNEELIAYPLVAFTACLMIYLTLPAILFSFFGITNDNLTIEVLWESPLSFTQGVALFGSLFLSALLLMFIQRVKQARASGTRIIPLWFIALIVGLFAAFIIVLFAFAFSVFTIEFITSASKESLIAALFIFLVVILTMRFLR